MIMTAEKLLQFLKLSNLMLKSHKTLEVELGYTSTKAYFKALT
jgi:hypothetical protein